MSRNSSCGSTTTFAENSYCSVTQAVEHWWSGTQVMLQWWSISSECPATRVVAQHQYSQKILYCSGTHDDPELEILPNVPQLKLWHTHILWKNSYCSGTQVVVQQRSNILPNVPQLELWLNINIRWKFLLFRNSSCGTLMIQNSSCGTMMMINFFRMSRNSSCGTTATFSKYSHCSVTRAVGTRSVLSCPGTRVAVQQQYSLKIPAVPQLKLWNTDDPELKLWYNDDQFLPNVP